MQDSLRARRAMRSDIDSLIAVERAAWTGSGAPLITPEQFEIWLQYDSPFFVVAENSEGVCGYYFGITTDFSPDRVSAFLDPKLVTGLGWSTHPHIPSADALYGISVAASSRGAGRVAIDHVRDVMEVLGTRYFLGFARMTGFDSFVHSIKKSGVLPWPESDLALWYAHENARLLKLPVWEQAPEKPSLELESLTEIDPVIAFHVKGSTAGFMSILPNYMPDSQSRNYGVLLVSERPHR